VRGRALIALFLSAPLLPASAAAVEPPPGPRLTLLRWTLEPPTRDIVTMAPNGSEERILLRAREGDVPVPRLYFAPSWSPDGETLAFTGVVGLRRVNRSNLNRTKIFLVNADGSGLRVLPGTAEGFEPVFAPDGRTIAFTKKRRRWKPNGHGGKRLVYVSNTAWLMDLATGQMRQLTPWRNHVANVPTSFAPDGQTLAMTRRPGRGVEAVAMSLADGRVRALADNALDPIYSPDGAALAFLRGRVRRVKLSGGTLSLIVPNLFIANTDGSEARNITRVSEGGIATPHWDPSGERLVYIQTDLSADQLSSGVGDTVMEINADGTCPTPILTDPNISYSGTTWQPGPGRQAGRIAC
jgi:Tol biopolymer transport system component